MSRFDIEAADEVGFAHLAPGHYTLLIAWPDEHNE
jgi:hypothetical protein